VSAFDLTFDATIETRLAQMCAAFPRQTISDAGRLKRAAVAMTLVEHAGTLAFLLTLRASALRAHANQFALPGGRIDPGESVEEAALRELEEELGVACGAENILGALDDYETRSGYLITPLVIFAGAGRSYRPSAQEVARLHIVPFADLMAPDFARFEKIPQSDRPLLRLRMLDDFIHAPTGAFIYQFRELLLGRIARVAHMEQPVFAWR
jgi:8-oxo-dGTP pyrophosphatase MutT (NUDIX family)